MALLFPQEIFPYSYLAGPVETPDLLDKPIKSGNCRLALQLYFYKIHNHFLEKDDIYLPGGYKTLGSFVFEEKALDLKRLRRGDIIYAQNLRNKKGDLLKRNLSDFSSKDEWLYHLHSAIYIGKYGEEEHCIWHATNIEGTTSLWPLERFLCYYKPISAKRISL